MDIKKILNGKIIIWVGWVQCDLNQTREMKSSIQRIWLFFATTRLVLREGEIRMREV
jgi:hypothetical protein